MLQAVHASMVAMSFMLAPICEHRMCSCDDRSTRRLCMQIYEARVR